MTDRSAPWRIVLLAVAAVIIATVSVVTFVVVRGAGKAADPPVDKAASPTSGLAEVQALQVDPSDGQLYAATALGLLDVPQQGPAIRLGNERQNLESLAVIGPGHFVASGHSGDARSIDQAAHTNLGLIETTDGGRTWRTLSLQGEAHFHALEFRHGMLYGAEEATSRFMVTKDRVNWEPRSSTPLDAFTVSPSNPELVLAIEEGRLMRSENGGRAFTPVAGAPILKLITWPSDDVVFAATHNGVIHVSEDGGATWQRRGNVRGIVGGLAASDATHVFAAAGSAVYASADGGQSFAFRAGATASDAALPQHVKVGPEGAAFYQPPAVPPDAKPGDLIWARPVGAPDGTVGYGIMYWSERVDGQLVAVSGVLFRPANLPADQPRSITAWAHGTFGLADKCAPSLGFFQGNGASLPIVRAATGEGAIFVASDYEGLGTPGEHPFMVNQSSGRNVLDSIRAAQRFTESAPDTNTVIMGQSQGGGAALFAAELQPAYAPELRLLGSIAVSPPSRMKQLHEQMSGGEYFGYALMMLHGYQSAYPELAGSAGALTPAGQAALQEIPTQCADQILPAYSRREAAEFGTAPVLGSPEFAKLFDENEPGEFGTGVPILIVHGEADGTIYPDNSRDLLRRYCDRGVPVQASFYPGKGHLDVLNAALPEILPYVTNRLAGTPGVAVCE